DPTPQDAVAEVEHALVGQQAAVTDVEGLVVDEQADDLPVGDVEDRLTRLRVAVAGLGVGERPQLVERVQVRPRNGEGLALVEVGAQADVPVRECEDGFRLREHVEVQVRLSHAPRLDHEGGMGDHGCAISSTRSETTTSAPCSRSASRCPALWRPASRAARTYRTEPSKTWTPSRFSSARTSSFLRLPRPRTVSADGRSLGLPSGSRIPRAARNERTPS